MRSRTSRGVSEWSGDEDLCMESPYSVAGSVWGYRYFTGTTEGVPGVHLPRGATWAVRGRPSLNEPGEPAPKAHVHGKGETLKGEAST